MIKCNLAVLLAERNIKISELSKRTGISRTTLTALNQNQSKGIQFDTFDTLCSYLKISPNDLFIQEKFEYDFLVLDFVNKPRTAFSRGDEYTVKVQSEIEYKSNVINTILSCDINVYGNGIEIENVSITPNFPNTLIEILNFIPITFKTSLEQELTECIKSEIIIKYNLDEDDDFEINIW